MKVSVDKIEKVLKETENEIKCKYSRRKEFISNQHQTNRKEHE